MLKALIDIFLPPVCHCCGEKLVEGERYVCMGCLFKLPRTMYHLYWNDHSSPNSDINPMENRFAGLFPFVHATSGFFYGRDSIVSELVKDFKYHKFPGLATFLGEVLADELRSTGFFSGIDYILPIPIHWTKKLKRGYNQTLMLARGLSAVTSIPVSQHLVALRSHHTQTRLSLDSRRENTKNLFLLKNAPSYAGRHVLILDDICTTGATMTSAAEACIAACPGLKISLLSLGVTY